MKILPDHYYKPDDAELRVIAAVQTLARWRCEGTGPNYLKAGGRVLYSGSDILDWLESHTVTTAA